MNHGIGFELLKKPEIRARIDQAMAERSKRTGINADRVLRELGRIAFLNPKDVIDLDTAKVLDTATEDDLAVIAGVKVKQTSTELGTSVEREVKMADKLKALELRRRRLSSRRPPSSTPSSAPSTNGAAATAF